MSMSTVVALGNAWLVDIVALPVDTAAVLSLMTPQLSVVGALKFATVPPDVDTLVKIHI